MNIDSEKEEVKRTEYYLDGDLDLCLWLAFLPDLCDFSVDRERLRLDFLDFLSLLTSGEGDLLLLDSESEYLLLLLLGPFLPLLSERAGLPEASLWESVCSLSLLRLALPLLPSCAMLSFSFALCLDLSFLSTSFSFFFLSFSPLRLLSLLLSLSLLDSFCLRRLRLRLRLRSRLCLRSSLRLRLPFALSLDLLLRPLLGLLSRERLRFPRRPERSALRFLLPRLLSRPFSRSLGRLRGLRLRGRVRREGEGLRRLFLLGEEERDELREEEEEEDEEEERVLELLELEREALGEALPLAPQRPACSLTGPACSLTGPARLTSLASCSGRALRLSASLTGSASLTAALSKLSVCVCSRPTLSRAGSSGGGSKDNSH